MKKLMVMLAITSLVGCADKELERCIEKADMRYQGCVSKPLMMTETCDNLLKRAERSCERESKERDKKRGGKV